MLGPDLASVDLNLMKALDALLLERSVTRAAARLSVTQPTMSASLKRLRVLFGDELLIRGPDGMHPTPLAETLEAPAREILALIESTLMSASSFDPARDERSFSVLATEFPALIAVAPLTAALANEAPGVQIEIQIAQAPMLTEHRSLETADIAIVPSMVAEKSQLPRKSLFTDEFVAAVWAENDVIGDRLSRRDFERLPYLALRQDGTESLADQRLQQEGIDVTPRLVCGSFLVAAFMLRGTDTVTFLQRSLVERLADAAEIRVVDTVFTLPTIHEVAIWHPRHENDPAHRWLRERLADRRSWDGPPLP